MSVATMRDVTPLSGEVEVCSPRGTLEAATAAEFREEAASVCGSAHVVFDLSEVTFIDSCGLGALIGAIRRVREHGGRVVLCSPRAPVTRLLRVVGMDRLVTVHDSLVAAAADVMEAG